MPTTRKSDDPGLSCGWIGESTSPEADYAKGFAFDFHTNKSTSFPSSRFEAGARIGDVPGYGEDQGNSVFCGSLSKSGLGDAR